MLGVIKERNCGCGQQSYGDERETKIIKGAAGIINVEDLVARRRASARPDRRRLCKAHQPRRIQASKSAAAWVLSTSTPKKKILSRRFLTTSTHSDLLFFTDLGKAYQIKFYELPEGKRSTKGKAVVNFLSITDTEKVSSVLADAQKR